MKDDSLEDFRRHLARINGVNVPKNNTISEAKETRSQQKKREQAADAHASNLVHAYMTARANDKNPTDLMGAHQRAAKAAAAKHPTDHMGRPTHAADVENAVRFHLNNVSGRIHRPNDPDGNQVRQGLSGNQYTGHPDNTKGSIEGNQVRQGLRGNQN